MILLLEHPALPLTFLKLLLELKALHFELFIQTLELVSRRGLAKV